MSTELAFKPQSQGVAVKASTDEQLIDLFIRRKRSQHTRRTYATAIEQFRGFLGYKPLANVTLEDMLDYSDHVQQAYASKSTQQLKLNVVRSLLTFGQKVGYLQFNVGAAVETPKPENTLAERIISEEQALQVINTPRRKRDKLILRLLYSAGLRVSELCDLQWRHVQPNGQTGQLTVYGKGQKTRHIPLSEATYEQLVAFRPVNAEPGDPVFVSQKGGKLDVSAVFRIVQRAGTAAGVDGLSPHWLRHAHASHSLARGASVVVVKETLGHANIATTNNYVHAKPSESSSFDLAV